MIKRIFRIVKEEGLEEVKRVKYYPIQEADLINYFQNLKLLEYLK